MTIKTQIRANPEQHCSICKDQGEGLMLCATCSTAQHASCMIEFGGCSGCGESDPHGTASKQANEDVPYVPCGVSLAEVRNAPAYTPPAYRPPCPRHEADQLDSATRRALLFGEGDASCNCPALVARRVLLKENLGKTAVCDPTSNYCQSHLDCDWHKLTTTDNVVASPPSPMCNCCYDGRVVPEGDEFGDGTSSCPKCCPQEPEPRNGIHNGPCVSCAPHSDHPGDMQARRASGCSCCSCWRYRSEKRRRARYAQQQNTDASSFWPVLLFMLCIPMFPWLAKLVWGYTP